MTGLVLIHKPEGYTSFDVVAVMRRVLGTRKIGHTGTLDPMATGVLPLLVGKATRLCDLMPTGDKTYRATMQLGLTTDTLDRTGKILTQTESHVTENEVKALLATFVGAQMQTPPMYSAVSVDGVRLYDLARQGKTVERQARPITVYDITYEHGDEATQTFTFSVSCSKGTYIRSLIDDMGKALGCGGIMTALCRTKACGFALSECVDIEKAKEMTAEELVLPVERAVEGYPAVRVTEAQAKRFANGGPLDITRLPISRHATGIYRVITPDHTLLGLGRVDTEKCELKIQCFL
jgi:tRNA pseudouridine55 synthase